MAHPRLPESMDRLSRALTTFRVDGATQSLFRIIFVRGAENHDLPSFMTQIPLAVIGAAGMGGYSVECALRENLVC
jgi:hypothetical protein